MITSSRRTLIKTARLARAGSGHQPVCQARLHRSSDPVVRCVLEIHEDDFLNGQRSIHKPMGGPIPGRMCARMRHSSANLVNDFDFTQAPRAPLVLPEHPIRPGLDPWLVKS